MATTPAPTATGSDPSRQSGTGRPGDRKPQRATTGGWTLYAKVSADEGIDALELNIYRIAADPEVAGADIKLDTSCWWSRFGRRCPCCWR